MPIVRVTLPFYLPRRPYQLLRRIKGVVFAAKPVMRTIGGERQVEWSFITSRMPSGPGEALDFGCEFGDLSLLAAFKGFRVTAIDLQEQSFPWRETNVRFIQGDLLELELPENHFDIIINCSSVEHVGVPGRYGITVEQSDGDIRVMQRFADILKPDGLLLMTAPCGRDALMAPWCRVYGQERIPRLLAPFWVEKEAYWVKDETNCWVSSNREDALAFVPRHDPTNPHGCSYALSGLVLRKRVRASQDEPREVEHAYALHHS